MPNHVKLVEDHLIVSYIGCRELCPEWLLASAADHFYKYFMLCFLRGLLLLLAFTAPNDCLQAEFLYD